jgi:excisionase family DNA binding protein
MEDERYFTVPQVAAKLQVHENTVRSWIYKRCLRAKLVAGAVHACWRIREHDLDAFVDAGVG